MAKLTESDLDLIRKTVDEVLAGYIVGLTDIDGAVGANEVSFVSMPETSTKQRVEVVIRICANGEYPDPD